MKVISFVLLCAVIRFTRDEILAMHRPTKVIGTLADMPDIISQQTLPPVLAELLDSAHVCLFAIHCHCTCHCHCSGSYSEVQLLLFFMSMSVLRIVVLFVCVCVYFLLVCLFIM